LLNAGLQPTDVALHPYPYDPNVAVNAALDSAMAVLDSFGYSGTRVWVTEWGIDHRLPGLTRLGAFWQTRVGLRRLTDDPRIDRVSVFALTEKGRRDYGLVRFDGTLGPAGQAVSGWIGGRGVRVILPPQNPGSTPDSLIP
jgi:hypothetical protein